MANSVDFTTAPHSAVLTKRSIVWKPTTALLVNDHISIKESPKQSTTEFSQQKSEQESANILQACDSTAINDRQTLGGALVYCSCKTSVVPDADDNCRCVEDLITSDLDTNWNPPSCGVVDHICPTQTQPQCESTVVDSYVEVGGRFEGQSQILSEAYDLSMSNDEEVPSDGELVASRQSQKQSRKRGREDPKKLRKSKPPKPNSFVAVQIASPLIRKRLKNVQDSMINHDKQLEKVLTSLKKLHITLMVIRMENDSDIERGRNALNEASRLINDELKGATLSLKFDGLNSFGSRVVFVQVSDGVDVLHTIAGIVQEVFQRNGLKSTDKRNPFNPHATIAKISSHKPRSIPLESYSNFADSEFGIETVTSIELLSMTEPQDADGYYHCFERAWFN